MRRPIESDDASSPISASAWISASLASANTTLAAAILAVASLARRCLNELEVVPEIELSELLCVCPCIFTAAAELVVAASAGKLFLSRGRVQLPPSPAHSAGVGLTFFVGPSTAVTEPDDALTSAEDMSISDVGTE